MKLKISHKRFRKFSQNLSDQMNIREALLKEHSKQQCNNIVQYIGNSQQRFNELIKLFFGNEYRVVQRAAWVLSYSAIKHPALIKTHLKKAGWKPQ